MYYLYLCLCTSTKCMSVELKQFEEVYLFIWSHDFRFSMSLSLSPNSLYRQTTDCTEGGSLTREHCKYNNILNISCLAENQQIVILKFLVWPYQGSKPWSTTLTITLSIHFVCCVNRIPYDWDFVNKTVLIIISFSAISYHCDHNIPQC